MMAAMSSLRSRILKLEAPEEFHPEGLRYADEGFTPEDAAEMRRQIESEGLILAKDPPDTVDFLITHGWQLVAELEGAGALEFLLDELAVASAIGGDGFLDLFPHLALMMGNAAVEPLVAAFVSQERTESQRIAILEALEEFLHAGIGSEAILPALRASLEGEPDLRTLKAFIVAWAIDHAATDLLPAIRQAYQDNLVDVSICGDLDEVEVDFGVRARRSTPRRNWIDQEAELVVQSRLSRFGPLPLDAGDDELLAHSFLLFSDAGGVRSLAQLDGFLVGVITSPYLLRPSFWIPQVWTSKPDLAEPAWPSDEAAKRIMQALMSRYNTVLGGVAGRSLAPPADEDMSSWLDGFLDGTSLWGDESFGDGSAHDLLLDLVVRKVAPGKSGAEPSFETILRAAGNAYDARSAESAPARYEPPTHPIHRESPKVGRNDPCPCGSGKKFKACCME